MKRSSVLLLAIAVTLILAAFKIPYLHWALKTVAKEAEKQNLPPQSVQVPLSKAVVQPVSQSVPKIAWQYSITVRKRTFTGVAHLEEGRENEISTSLVVTLNGDKYVLDPTETERISKNHVKVKGNVCKSGKTVATFVITDKNNAETRALRKLEYSAIITWPDNKEEKLKLAFTAPSPTLVTDK